ncbi:MAG TPA: zf-HC2 domain-containing protein [Candidatus Baltobacteraceae bacterium]|nr:zf-HC2 domain-containing protein [Candidatus Baltobacteraceae bacterium]
MTTHYDRDILIDYVHGELTPEADAAVFEHLEICTACRAAHDEEAALGETLRTLARGAELELPSMVKARVWDAVRRERPSWLERLRAGLAPRFAVPVAALVLAGLYFGVPIFHAQQPAPGIAAAFFLDEHNAEVQQNPLGPGVSPAVYGVASDRTSTSAASYIDTADAATLDDAVGAYR